MESTDFETPDLDKLAIDISNLTASFNHLKTSTDQIFKEADKTASYLQDQLHNTIFRFFGVIDSIVDIILVKSADGKWKTLNKSGQDIFGFNDISEFYGLTDLELITKYPNLTMELQQCIEADNAAWTLKTHYRHIEFFSINGKDLILDVIKTPTFNRDDTPKELIIVGRDITEMYHQNIFIQNNRSTNESTKGFWKRLQSKFR